jgi:yecA family protein
VDTVYQLKIALQGVRPPVWRRVLVRESLTLRRLHDVIQAVMGWNGSHLHLFSMGDRVYGPTDLMPDERGMGEGVYSDRNVRLSALDTRGITAITYTYDLGDDWCHTVTLEAKKSAEPGVAYPAFVTGKGACPPEDVGGPPGYADFLDIMADPDHPDHAETSEWVGAKTFDPKALDRAAIETRLDPIRSAARKGPKRKAKPQLSPQQRDPSLTPADGAIAFILAMLRDGAEAKDIPPYTIRQIISDPGTAPPLLGAILEAEQPKEDLWVLLVRVLDEARMDAEGGGARGPAFLTAVEATLNQAFAEISSVGPSLGLIASAYDRAGLAVPSALTTHDFPETALPPDELAALAAQMDADFGRMMAEVVNPRDLHDTFAEILAGLPDEGKAVIVARVSGRAEAAVPRLILYWLLHPAQEVRLVAADALADRSSPGLAACPPVSLLVAVRRWMPADAARDTLDTAMARIRKALAAASAESLRTHPPVLQALVSSVPDGAGAQHFAALVRQDGHLRAALVLLKAGHGVKDAFVIDDSPEDVEAVFDKAAELCHWNVDLETMTTAVGAALTECADLGRPPPAGLLDVLEALPVDTFDPMPATPEDWADRVDPGREIRDATPQLRGRLVNESDDWPIFVPLVDCWFETDGALEAAVLEARSEAAARRAVFSHLEDRRAYWAVQCFRAAQVLRADMALRLAQSFVAVGLALLDGRPLKKIPIMDYVVRASLTHVVRTSLSTTDEATAPDRWTDHGDATVALDPADLLMAGPPDAQALRRLETYLRQPGLADDVPMLAELDGYLHAVAVVDPAIGLETWLSAMWGGAPPPFADPDQVRDILTTIFGRYAQILNALDSDNASHTIIIGIDDPDEVFAEDWAAGFVDGMKLDLSAWRSLRTKAAEPLAPIIAAAGDPAVPAPPGLSEEDRDDAIYSLPERAPALLRDLRRIARTKGRKTTGQKSKRR